jgi:hypothetical protein
MLALFKHVPMCGQEQLLAGGRFSGALVARLYTSSSVKLSILLMPRPGLSVIVISEWL